MMRDRSFAANIFIANTGIANTRKVLAKTGQVEHKLLLVSNVPDFQKIVQCLMANCLLNNFFIPLKVLPIKSLRTLSNCVLHNIIHRI